MNDETKRMMRQSEMHTAKALQCLEAGNHIGYATTLAQALVLFGHAYPEDQPYIQYTQGRMGGPTLQVEIKVVDLR